LPPRQLEKVCRSNEKTNRMMKFIRKWTANISRSLVCIESDDGLYIIFLTFSWRNAMSRVDSYSRTFIRINLYAILIKDHSLTETAIQNASWELCNEPKFACIGESAIQVSYRKQNTAIISELQQCLRSLFEYGETPARISQLAVKISVERSDRARAIR
jgi:hypothetical protein